MYLCHFLSFPLSLPLSLFFLGLFLSLHRSYMLTYTKHTLSSFLVLTNTQHTHKRIAMEPK